MGTNYNHNRRRAFLPCLKARGLQPEDFDEYVKLHIQRNKGKYICKVELDRAIEIDGKLVIGIECKSYIENAMLKRTLKDFELIEKLLYPQLIFCVFQFENGLGGDYGEVSKQVQLGSESTHTLLFHTPTVRLEIITLLDEIENQTEKYISHNILRNCQLRM